MFENIVGFVCDECAAKIHVGEPVCFSEAVGWLESEGITDANWWVGIRPETMEYPQELCFGCDEPLMGTSFIAEVELSKPFAENYSLWGGRRVDMDDDWE